MPFSRSMCFAAASCAHTHAALFFFSFSILLILQLPYIRTANDFHDVSFFRFWSFVLYECVRIMLVQIFFFRNIVQKIEFHLKFLTMHQGSIITKYKSKCHFMLNWLTLVVTGDHK